MSLQNELKALLYLLPRLFKDLWEHEKNLARHYIYGIVIAVFLLCIGIGSFFGYRWYVVSREQRTQLLLAEHLEELQRIVDGSPEAMAVQLAQLESSLSFDHERYKSRAIAPLFLLVKADAQVKQGKHEEAIGTLQQLLDGLPSDYPLINLIKTNRALLQLDSADEAIQKTGLQDLIMLAREQTNKQSDIALFYLGRYYWAHDKFEDAKLAWQELLNNPYYTQLFPSPWAHEAQEALAQMG